MPDWLITILTSALGSALVMAASAICKWILKKAFSKEIEWSWVIVLTSVSFLVGIGFLIYQQANPNGDLAQVTPTAHQNVPSTPSDNSDSVPSKANPEERRPTPIHTPRLTPVPTSTPTHTSTPDPTATPAPIPVSPPAATLALSPTIRPDKAILSVVIDRNPHSARPLHVQTLSTLVTGADGLSVEIHNAVCNNTEHINTKEWVQLRCGYYEETQEQTVIEYIVAWHESVGYLRCEADGIPNSLTMEFRCFAE